MPTGGPAAGESEAARRGAARRRARRPAGDHAARRPASARRQAAGHDDPGGAQGVRRGAARRAEGDEPKTLRGGDRRLQRGADAADLKPTRPPLPLADPRAAARVEPLPFWLCSDCKVVAPGLSGQCVRCGNTVAFMQVREEDERRTAVAALSA